MQDFDVVEDKLVIDACPNPTYKLLASNSSSPVASSTASGKEQSTPMSCRVSNIVDGSEFIIKFYDAFLDADMNGIFICLCIYFCN
jgi:hypothetical protein